MGPHRDSSTIGDLGHLPEPTMRISITVTKRRWGPSEAALAEMCEEDREAFLIMSEEEWREQWAG